MANKVTLEDLQQIIKNLGELVQEVAKAQKETEASHKEVAAEQKKTEEAHQKTEEAHQKTEEAQQKTEEAQQKTAEALQDFKREMAEALQDFKKETKEALNGAVGEFNEKWSTFMENLVKEDLLNLMQEKNIDVHALYPNVIAMSRGKKKKTHLAEFDLLAVNGDELVVVETKTTLFTKDVVGFVEKIKKFKSYFPIYKNHKVYGAVAYMGEARDEKGKAAKLAEDEGLFVIKSPEGGPGMAVLANKEGFTPKAF